MVAIRGIQISKSYQYYLVLKQISFEVGEGECYALFGPNGAGKTTLLRILATILTPTGGRFEIMGRDGVSKRQEVRGLLLHLGHGSYLYDELNAVENIRLTMAFYGKNPADQEIKRALDRVGIGAFADLRTRFYSMGMKKRLAVARAMLIRPQVLLMDEPYASLDESGMGMVNGFIREIKQQGTAVLFTTHNRERTIEIADRVGILKKGDLTEMTVEELRAKDELF
jgi:heme ABC exporter ATP-binding subunit CcmA